MNTLTNDGQTIQCDACGAWEPVTVRAYRDLFDVDPPYSGLTWLGKFVADHTHSEVNA